jgi:hypothetical protein
LENWYLGKVFGEFGWVEPGIRFGMRLYLDLVLDCLRTLCGIKPHVVPSFWELNGWVTHLNDLSFGEIQMDLIWVRLYLNLGIGCLHTLDGIKPDVVHCFWELNGWMTHLKDLSDLGNLNEFDLVVVVVVPKFKYRLPTYPWRDQTKCSSQWNLTWLALCHFGVEFEVWIWETWFYTNLREMVWYHFERLNLEFGLFEENVPINIFV